MGDSNPSSHPRLGIHIQTDSSEFMQNEKNWLALFPPHGGFFVSEKPAVNCTALGEKKSSFLDVGVDGGTDIKLVSLRINRVASVWTEFNVALTNHFHHESDSGVINQHSDSRLRVGDDDIPVFEGGNHEVGFANHEILLEGGKLTKFSLFLNYSILYGIVNSWWYFVKDDRIW